ncbi:hypothetical protein [Nocardia sp. CNY236]|uniref:hypothetical protein n=1 Tax=Nocardia sp. CNY236 TaxID=1169152 RepID=UPI000411D50E|nr:hypothetical protein [Nocardia sp. CNY236]
MTEQSEVAAPEFAALDSGVRRTDTGIALRAVTAADTTPTQDVLGSDDRAALDALLDAATVPNTVRTYRAPVERFDAWCAERGYQARPADPEVVAAFLAFHEKLRDEDGYTYPLSTLTVWTAAIRRDHLDGGHPDPTEGPLVAKAVMAAKRKRTKRPGRPTASADPLLADDIRRLVDSIAAHAAEDDGWPAKVAACRDTALILSGFASARRRSEIAGLQFGDLSIVRDPADTDRSWIQLRLRGTKTSSTAMEYAYLHCAEDPRYCPRCALMDWLIVVTVHDNSVSSAATSGDTNQQRRAARRAMIDLMNQTHDRDPHQHRCDRNLPFHRRSTALIWRPLTKTTRYLPSDTGHPFADRNIARILKYRCQQADFDPERIERISGHSLRSGFVTQLRGQEVSNADIMRQTGHKRTDTLIRHYDKTPGFRNNGVDDLPL